MKCIESIKKKNGLEGVADKKESSILPPSQTWKGLQPQLMAHPLCSVFTAQAPHFVQ